MSSSAGIDVFIKYKNENRLNDESTVKECFKYFDKNNDNFLDLAEFERLLGVLYSFNGKPYNIPKDDVNKIFQHFHPKDNKLSHEQFHQFWNKIVIPTLNRKTALVIVDVQNDFINGTMALVECPAKQEGSEVVPVINKLIDTVPFDVIAYTLDWHPDDHCSFIENVHNRQLSKQSPTKENIKKHDIVIFEAYPDIEQKLWPAHCVQDSKGAELHPDLKIVDENTDSLKRKVVYAKKGSRPDIDSYSAFFDNCKLNETTLNSDLKKYDVDEIYVCGLAADVCVAATSADGLDLNYRVAFIEDACRGIVAEDIETQKQHLVSKGGIIVTSKDVLNMVSGKDRRHTFALTLLKSQ